MPAPLNTVFDKALGAAACNQSQSVSGTLSHTFSCFDVLALEISELMLLSTGPPLRCLSGPGGHFGARPDHNSALDDTQKAMPRHLTRPLDSKFAKPEPSELKIDMPQEGAPSHFITVSLPPETVVVKVQNASEMAHA